MNEQQFDGRLRHIEEQARAGLARVVAYRDQEIARLFIESGWTQDRIAKRMGRSQSWVGYRLVFGRFLQFTTTGGIFKKPPKNLTERRFRSYFEQTDKTAKEQHRFAAVLKLMEEAFELHAPRTPSRVGHDIRREFANGKWIKPETMAEKLDAPPDQVIGVLERMRINGAHQCHAERRTAGKATEYRVIKGSGKRIDVETLRVEVSPIIKQLEVEGKKNMATFSPLTVLDCAHKLKRLLDKLAK